jgi:hypothetical protein
MRAPITIASSPWNASRLPRRILPAISGRARSSSGGRPSTRAPTATPLAAPITWRSTTGAAVATPATARNAATAGAGSASVPPDACGSIVTCALMPWMRAASSARKPFITDITMISAATPSPIEMIENQALTEMKPS